MFHQFLKDMIQQETGPKYLLISKNQINEDRYREIKKEEIHKVMCNKKGK